MTNGLRGWTAASALTLGLILSGLLMLTPAKADGITDGNAGRDALLEGRLDDAIHLFTRAMTLGGLNARNGAITLNLRGNAYLEKGQTEVALDDLNESLRLEERIEARFTRAKIFIAQFRFDDAVGDLTKAIELGGGAPEVYALRGHAHLYAGERNEAIRDLDRSLALQPDYEFALRTRGHAYLNLGENDKAIADETRAIQLDPKDSEAYWLRAYAYRYRKNQPLKAIKDYSAALKIEPADSTNRTSRADAYEALGRYAEASADYDEWIKQNPRRPFGYFARGRLGLIQGKTAQATEDLLKAVSLKPTDPYYPLWLHLARAKAGIDDSAELSANADRINKTIWPGPLYDYLVGRDDAATVLAKAGAALGKTRTHQLCEAQMFLGQNDIAKGRTTEGTARLQLAVDECDGSTQEARLIKADLRQGAATSRQIAPPTPAPPPRSKTKSVSRPARPARHAHLVANRDRSKHTAHRPAHTKSKAHRKH